MIAGLRAKADAIRRAEVDKTLRHLKDLNEADKRRIEALSEALVSKLLHDPTLRLKAEAGNGHAAEYAAAVRHLFALGTKVVMLMSFTYQIHLQHRLHLIGTRGSALARWQTDWVIARFKSAWPELDCTIKLFHTSGDKILDKPLPEIGGKGLFTEELENALKTGEIDLAVHSLKDLPIDNAAGLTIGAICEREDPRDVLVSRQYHTLKHLPHGARVGTSSLRRAAQLLAARPDLKILSLRGNVDTRIRKAMQGEYDAIVLAAAGVLRLGFESHIAEYLLVRCDAARTRSRRDGRAMPQR